MYARVPSSRRYEMILKVTSSIRLVLNSKSKFRFMRLVSLPQYDGRRKIPWNINRCQRRSYCRRKILRFWVHPKLGEGTNMSVDSAPTSTCDGTMTMMLDNSSVASTDLLSRTVHHDFPRFTAAGSIGNSVGHRVFRSSGITHALNADALVQSLMDPNFPVQGLHDYNEWTLDLRMLNTGEPFAQGAFGKLYRGTYGGEDVAIKLLERPENDPERSRLMEHLFAQEVIMLASLRHSNIVRFIGACRNPMVRCIVTEFAKGGSVRQFLSKRQNSSAPLNITVRQALDVARGMAYIHSLGFIHMDLKSDNLLMWG